MDSERAGRLVARLRARGVMAHVHEVGVYQCGVRVVLPDGVEALWDTDGAAGLEAEIVRDGVLIGFVPRIDGSDEFTDPQLVDAIAGARYSEEGLSPPSDAPPRAAPPASPARERPRPRWWRR